MSVSAATKRILHPESTGPYAWADDAKAVARAYLETIQTLRDLYAMTDAVAKEACRVLAEHDKETR